MSQGLVLVVDDNRDFCECIKDVLELLGYRAVTAYDGLEALERAREEHPKLVLLDMDMPRLDGLTALKRLREIDPHLPVVIMTAYGEEGLVQKALKEGASGYLVKPLDMPRLCTLIAAKVTS